jgi:hypothetical protein
VKNKSKIASLDAMAVPLSLTRLNSSKPSRQTLELGGWYLNVSCGPVEINARHSYLTML